MIEFNSATCNACGNCAVICPRYIFEQIEGGAGKPHTELRRERIDACIACGHCMALCATGSIRVDGLDPAGFAPIEPARVEPAELVKLLQNRRTVRRYKPAPVPRDLLDRVVQAARTAPTANSKGVGIIVIDREEPARELARHAYALYESLLKASSNPIGRHVLRHKVGKNRLVALRNFVFPGLRWYIKWYRDGRSDEIRRDAPALLLFHACVTEPSMDESCFVAATYAMLMAECLGLGSVINGLVAPACNRSPQARKLLALPDDHEVYAALSLGYPLLKFKKRIPRAGGTVRYLA
jgi:nitroreductase/NAD-dependent dihydropyrimidine dehydrogenase PreA subunit